MTPAPPEHGMLPSPCVGICRLDNATGWCLGCARDTNELTNWRVLSPAEQARVWADLPRRKIILGLRFRLRSWSGEVLMAALVDLARQPNIGWSIGVYGAVAEFVTRSATIPEIEIGDDGLILRTSGGSLRLRPPPGTRMFELVDAAGGLERRVLALHRSRLREAPASGVTELGADEEAIGPAHRTERLFDLGVTRSMIRFCVRTGEASLIAALRRANGLDALNPTIGLVPALLASSPDRVAISPIGRIEVFGPIIRSDQGGPHTHLLPQLLACGNELKPGFALPEGYEAGASMFSVAGTASARACEYRAPMNSAAGSSLRDELRPEAPAIHR